MCELKEAITKKSSAFRLSGTLCNFGRTCDPRLVCAGESARGPRCVVPWRPGTKTTSKPQSWRLGGFASEIPKRTELFAATAFALSYLLTRLFHQLLMAGQAFAQFLQPLAQLVAVARLLTDLVAQLLPELIALLVGASGHKLFALAKLLLVLLACLGHGLHSLLDLVRKTFTQPCPIPFQCRVTGLEPVLFTQPGLVALLGATRRVCTLRNCSTCNCNANDCNY